MKGIIYFSRARMPFTEEDLRFYIGSTPIDLFPTETVSIVSLPERTVVSIGASGAYTENNICEQQSKLEEWIANQSDWRPVAELYAVFWHGSMTLWFIAL